MLKQQRNATFDVAKAIGIFFLVSSHARWWHITSVFITFYMAFFFFVSGYFLKIKGKSLKTFFVGKMRNLYFPYIICSTCFIIFHNFFYSLGITPLKYDFNQYVECFANVVLMNNTEALLIPIWFIASLFITSILFGILFKLLSRISGGGGTYILLIIGWVLFLFNACFIKHNYWYCYCTLANTVLSSFVFLAAGYHIKERGYSIKISKKSILTSTFLLIILEVLIYLTRFFVDVRQNLCSNWCLYIPIAFIGIYLTLYISKVICTLFPNISAFLSYMGQNTMIILLLHPLIFKFIGLIQINIFHYPYSGDLSLWGNVNTNGVWAYIYCIAGCGIPLIMQYSLYLIGSKLHGYIVNNSNKVKGNE